MLFEIEYYVAKGQREVGLKWLETTNSVKGGMKQGPL